MFKNLMDFQYKRTRREAFGFYIAYFVLFYILGEVLARSIKLIMGEQVDFDFIIRVSLLLAAVLCVGLAYVIVQKKKILKNYSSILIILLSAVLAYYGGGMLGLIPVAYLTTK